MFKPQTKTVRNLAIAVAVTTLLACGAGDSVGPSNAGPGGGDYGRFMNECIIKYGPNAPSSREYCYALWEQQLRNRIVTVTPGPNSSDSDGPRLVVTLTPTEEGVN